jgi:hypothetical protein
VDWWLAGEDEAAAVRPERLVSSILRHDRKQNSYKIALLRALNDVVLSYPDLLAQGRDIAVPLRVLARYWVAYYWPFVAVERPILQGRQRRLANGGRSADLEFRPHLARLRAEWEAALGQPARAADGFFLIGDLMIARRGQTYPPSLLAAYERALRAIVAATKQPIRYAGAGEWTTFPRPARYAVQSARVIAVPGTVAAEECLIVPRELWATFHTYSLWVEALAIHEWCVFSEGLGQEVGAPVDRGEVYRLLTDRPDNRRPLTWERNQVDLCLLEGARFSCPWTGRGIDRHHPYDLDHLIPLAVYPMNDLWNLVPTDARFNQHEKRDRLPTDGALRAAIPRLGQAYAVYGASLPLGPALARDVADRFTLRSPGAGELALTVARYMRDLREVRNIASFGAT